MLYLTDLYILHDLDLFYNAHLIFCLTKWLKFCKMELRIKQPPAHNDYYMEKMMNLMFFEQIKSLDKSLHHISIIVVGGSETGNKALWSSESGYIYHKIFSQLWIEAAVLLPTIKMPTLMEVSGNQLFFEPVGCTPHLIICGAGHVSLPIITLSRTLGFHVTAIDDRPLFADNARTAQAHKVICNNFTDALADIPKDNNNYFVIVTRGHRFDMDCLKHILKVPFAYAGMMGSRARVRMLRKTMMEQGFTPGQLDQVHMPIGLNIYAESPEEIAVSIMAEIIQVRHEQYQTYCYSRELLNGLLNDSPNDKTTDKTNIKKALVTIIRRKGSAPRAIGTKMLVYETGQTIGTIGGGCVEAAVIQQAHRMIRMGTSCIFQADMTGREAADEGMVCGGVIDVYIEPQ